MKISFSFGSLPLSKLASLFEGDLLSSNPDFSVSGICTDSKEADEHTVFLALQGARADGHDYIKDAASRGCRSFICARVPEEIKRQDLNFVLVKDTQKALEAAANNQMDRLPAKVVAVTGSVGKTTTKDLIFCVLSKSKKTYCTKENHNSVIGMPLSVLEISDGTEYAVLEMGMSAFGEIQTLSQIAKPDYAIITNIGSSHLEALGSRENICRAKCEVLTGLKEGGTFFLPMEEPLLQTLRGNSFHTVFLSLECEKADYFAHNIRVTESGTTFDISYDGKTVKDLSLSLIGRHNVYAALYAFAVGIAEGMDPETIREGLGIYRPSGLRQNVIKIGGRTLIEDCYNASPESVRAAIDVLAELSKAKRCRSVAILGDMLELGGDSANLHRSVGKYLSEKQVDLVFAFGNMAKQYCLGAERSQNGQPETHFYPDGAAMETVEQELASILRPDDVVLLKGSRGMKMERFLPILER